MNRFDYLSLESFSFFPFAGVLGLVGHALHGGLIGWLALIIAVVACGGTLIIFRRHARRLELFFAAHFVALVAGLVTAEAAFDLSLRLALQNQFGGEVTMADLKWRKSIVAIAFGDRHELPYSNAAVSAQGCQWLWSFSDGRFIVADRYQSNCPVPRTANP